MLGRASPVALREKVGSYSIAAIVAESPVSASPCCFLFWVCDDTKHEPRAKTSLAYSEDTELDCYMIVYHPYRPLLQYVNDNNIKDRDLLQSAWCVFELSKYSRGVCLSCAGG